MIIVPVETCEPADVFHLDAASLSYFVSLGKCEPFESMFHVEIASHVDWCFTG